jgi:hypothetical protein
MEFNRLQALRVLEDTFDCAKHFFSPGVRLPLPVFITFELLYMHDPQNLNLRAGKGRHPTPTFFR